MDLSGFSSIHQEAHIGFQWNSSDYLKLCSELLPGENTEDLDAILLIPGLYLPEIYLAAKAS